MKSSRPKKRRLTYVSSRPRADLPATFESLNDDTLTTVLEFVGNKSYRSFGGLNKRCKEVYLNTSGMTKETFLYGYAPLSVITDGYDDGTSVEAREALSKGVIFYNRRDVLSWALEEENEDVLNRICFVAAREGRIDILNNVNDEDDDDIRSIFDYVDIHAARGGKLKVLKWFETKGLSIYEFRCVHEASRRGQLHIIKWLQEEKGLELVNEFYNSAIDGGQLHVMKWLREQEVDWDVCNFFYAARIGNLDILQWLQDEGCPWSEYFRLSEDKVKPEVVDWCRVNGYGNRIFMRR